MLNLRLTTPIQQLEPTSDADLAPSSLEKSLKEIQQATMVDRISLLDASISHFNELKLESSRRIKLLEVYFSSYQKLLQGFDEMRIAQLNVSAHQKKQVKKDIMWLYIKLSHGYKTVIKEYASQNETGKPPKDIVLAAFRALEVSYLSLLYSCRFDIEEPPLCFLEMNQVYAFAEYYDILTNPVRAAQGYAKTPTIESFYVLCMLFMDIDPRQYESYTLEVLFLAMQPMAFQCSVSKKLRYEPESYLYRVSLNENRCAEILLDDKVEAICKWTRYLNVDAFIKEMQDWLDKNQNSENSLLIEQELELFPALLTRLKINHSQKPKVDATRETAGGDDDKSCQLIIGLQQLESLLIMQLVGLDLHLKFSETHWTKTADTANGCELVSSEEFSEVINLGELVAIVSHCEGPLTPRKIGQIVALRQLDEHTLAIEIEFIQGSAHPLTYRRLTAEDKTIDYTSAIGIYFQDADNSDIPPQMLLPNKHFRNGQHYLIMTRERSFSIEACELVRRSMMYSFFSYKVVQPSVQNPNIPQQAVNDG